MSQKALSIHHNNNTYVTPNKQVYHHKNINTQTVKLVKFIVYEDGGWICAAGENDTIFTQAKTLKKLIKNIDEAVRCHFNINPGDFRVSLEFEPEALIFLSKGSERAQSTSC
jgi:predicted RNase H-like HicB family nuclease